MHTIGMLMEAYDPFPFAHGKSLANSELFSEIVIFWPFWSFVVENAMHTPENILKSGLEQQPNVYMSKINNIG